MKFSARNMLAGTVKSITDGAVHSEVVVSPPGDVGIVSITTKSSSERFNLKGGNSVFAVIKAGNIMIVAE